MWKKYIKQLSMPESYISITLGFLVVIVAGLLLFNYFSSKNSKKTESTTTKEFTEEVKKPEDKTSLPTRHIVAENETLWSIAQKYYNSGYNWVTIAKENKLTNADHIQTGQELSLPQAETIKPPEGAIGEATATVPEKTYTVVKGDNLWSISVKEYADGYAWTKIAKANNLVNPGLIHPGNVLRIPR